MRVEGTKIVLGVDEFLLCGDSVGAGKYELLCDGVVVGGVVGVILFRGGKGGV